jgi:hypothetical protein
MAGTRDNEENEMLVAEVKVLPFCNPLENTMPLVLSLIPALLFLLLFGHALMLKKVVSAPHAFKVEKGSVHSTTLPQPSLY